MIPVAYLFEDEDYLLFEGFINRLKRAFLGKKVEDLMEDSKVQEFIRLSEKTMLKSRVDMKDKQRLTQLMKERSVKQFLEQIDTNAKKQGAIGGAAIGGYGGALVGLGASIGISGPLGGAIVLALIGGTVFGVLGAAAGRKLAKMMSRWQRESQVQKQVSGIAVKQVQLTA